METRKEDQIEKLIIIIIIIIKIMLPYFWNMAIEL